MQKPRCLGSTQESTALPRISSHPRGLAIRRFAASCLLGLLGLLAAETATAGIVKGKVSGFEHLLNPVWDASKAANAHSYNFREPVPTVSAEMRRLFPYIPKELCIAILAATDQPKMKAMDVLVGGGRTTPVTLVVTPGTELHFKNTDPFPHRLFAVELKSFGPSDMAKGAERVWSVPEAGVYEIRDELVPSLRFWVVSEPKVVAVTYPDLSGQFQIDIATPGEYTVQPFFAGKAVGTAAAAPLANATAAVDLSRAPIVVGTKSQKPSEDSEKD
jgi:hypothetical protein